MIAPEFATFASHMKLSPVFALFAVCAPVIAYAQTAATPGVAASAALPRAPKSAETSDAFVWRFAPPVGSRWTMRSFTRSTSLTQMPAMDGQKAQAMKFISIQKITADYDILKRDALGATTIRLTLRDMANDVSSVLNGKIVNSQLPKNLNAKSVNGAQLTIKQAPDGAIWGVVGMRAFQRKILESSGLLDAATINQVLDANPMKDNSMIKSLNQVSGTLPTSPVRVGESWNYKVNMPVQLPMAFDISGMRTLKTLDPNIAVVADSALLGGSSSRKIPVLPEMGNISVNYSKIAGSMNGFTRVQRSSGLPLETTTNLTLRGQVATKIPAGPNSAAQTLTAPLDVTTSTRMVLEPRG